MKTLIFCLLIPFAVNAKVIEKMTPLPHAKNMKSISLRGVLLKGVQWNDKIILTELTKVNKIYSQCGIQFKDITISKANSTSSFASLGEVNKLALDLEKNKTKKRKEVVLVFASTITGELRKMGGEKTGGFSFNHASQEYAEKDELAMENIVVLLDIAHTEGYKIQRNSNYSPIAHELGHIFLNEGHVDEANLMASELNLVNAELTKEQCENLINSDLIRGK